MIITERDLPEFRAKYLRTVVIADWLEENGNVLLRCQPGVGKTKVVEDMLDDPEIHQRFKRILYVAPLKRNIESLRMVQRGANEGPIRWVWLKSRPAKKCGTLNDEWLKYEKEGNIALGRARVCGKCPLRKKCWWNKSLKEKTKGAKVVFCTEKMFFRIPNLVELLWDTSEGKDEKFDDRSVLLILDEALFINAPLEEKIFPSQMADFRAVLKLVKDSSMIAGTKYEELFSAYLKSLDYLLKLPRSQPIDDSSFLSFPREVGHFIVAIQEIGGEMFGDQFRDLTFPLQRLAAAYGERNRDDYGDFIFMQRSQLSPHTLILNGYHRRDYVMHQLRLHSLYSPFDELEVMHSGTKIWNIRSLIGAKRRFPGNKKQNLDFFATLILRNILDGKTTVLGVSKGKKLACVEYLKPLLERWLGRNIQFITDNYDENLEGKDSNPTVIPVIHYGLTGVNLFQDFDACYCLTSYYVNAYALEKLIFDGKPRDRASKPRLTIGKSEDRVRTIEVDSPDSKIIGLAEEFLFEMEMERVLQLVGRVRFYTKPREIILFQTNDLSGLFPQGVTEVMSLEEAAEAMGVVRASEFEARLKGAEAGQLKKIGYSMDEIATFLRVSRATTYRLIKDGYGELERPRLHNGYPPEREEELLRHLKRDKSADSSF